MLLGGNRCSLEVFIHRFYQFGRVNLSIPLSQVNVFFLKETAGYGDLTWQYPYTMKDASKVAKSRVGPMKSRIQKDYQIVARCRRVRYGLSVAGIVIAFSTLAGGCSREEPLEPNEILVTYEHGESCKWTDWSFRYRNWKSNNRASGAVMIAGPQTAEAKDDSTLRVFSENGEKIAIAGADLRNMWFTVEPDEDNSSDNSVVYLRVETDSDDYTFWPEPLPKFSRSRVLAPVASHYFSDVNDEYMTWGHVRMTLAGSVEEDCSTDREISLTRPDHYKKRTPLHIRFAGG